MENEKFVKTSDFDKPKYLRYLAFERPIAQQVGSRFADKYGKTNRLTFQDMKGGLEQKFILESTSFSFLIDFRNAKLKSGDTFLLVSVKLPHPEDDEKSFRRWIFQKVKSAPEKEPEPDREEITEDDISKLGGHEEEE